MPVVSFWVLLELQRMAAEKYAEARNCHDNYLYNASRGYSWRELEGDFWDTARAQRDAAALSRLVRVGLGIEPAEGD